MAAQYWTSKYGTKIDITGLDARTLAEVKRLADTKYGTKAADIAKTYQVKNKVASSVNKVTPTTTTPKSTTPTPATPLPENNRGETIERTDFKNPNDVAETDTKLKKDIAIEDTTRSNPDEIGPNSKKTVTYGPDGKPIVTTELTGPNKDLDEGQLKTGTIGTQVAGGLLNNFNYDPNSVDSKYAIPTVDSAYQSRYQQAAYEATTRNLEKRYAQEKEQKTQDLLNRGIPQNSPQFQEEMNRDVESRYDEQRQAAENNSYAGGLGAAQSNFGMGLQANQAATNNYNTSFGNRVAWGGQLNNLTQVRSPNNQGFQAAQTQGTDVAGIHGTQVGAQLSREQIAAQERIARINKAKTGGGAGNAPDNSPAVDV